MNWEIYFLKLENELLFEQSWIIFRRSYHLYARIETEPNGPNETSDSI